MSCDERRNKMETEYDQALERVVKVVEKATEKADLPERLGRSVKEFKALFEGAEKMKDRDLGLATFAAYGELLSVSLEVAKLAIK